jgi:8-oxo-dGTP pyrophosphatase MutT (NUDIX family)
VTADEYQVVGSQRRYDGRIISLRTDDVRMSDGTVSTREIVEHPGAVAIVAIDTEDRVVLVNQYRHPVGGYLLELPAGLLDVPGEPALAAAQRELFEEAALTATDWSLLVDLYPSPGMSTEAIRIFLARDLHDVDADSRYVAEHEELTMTVSRLALDDAVALAVRGDLTNAAAVAGVLAAKVTRSSGWQYLRPATSPWPARPDH